MYAFKRNYQENWKTKVVFSIYFLVKQIRMNINPPHPTPCFEHFPAGLT